MLSRYSPSLVSNPSDEMSLFVTEVANLVREECRTTMLLDDMAQVRLIVYSQSIEEYNYGRSARNYKRSVQVIKVDLELRRVLTLKRNLGVLRLNWRKEVVLKMSSLDVSLVEKGTIGNA